MNISTAITFATSVFILLPFAILFYKLLLHPLSRVPGPALGSISNAWYAYHVRNGSMLALGKTLHRHYGPVVRVGPNEVWFNSKEAYRAIYNASNGFEKSDFYLAAELQKPRINWRFSLISPDTLDLLAERDMKRYRVQRRLIGPIYHINNIRRYEKVLDDVLEKAIAQIKTLQGAEVDLKQWMHIIVVECLGAVSLSWSPGFLQKKTDGGSGDQSYLGWKRKSVFGLFPSMVIAESYCKWLGRKFADLWGLTYKTPSGFKPFFVVSHLTLSVVNGDPVYANCHGQPVSRQTSKRVAAALRPNPPNDTRSDLLADLIQLHKEKPEFNETYLRRMATTNFGAGHETTTSAATAVLAMLGSHPEQQRKVAEEVRSTAASSKFDNAVHLRYTQVSIKEAQRLYPVIGMSLPRKVPSQGLHLHDHYFPPGTTVGCNPISLHRNEDIFGAQVDDFRPERWLGQADIKEMERYNLNFGGGARTCPGRHLAEFILFKLVSTLIQEFDLKVSMPPEQESRYYFMAMLTDVKIRFLPNTSTGN